MDNKTINVLHVMPSLEVGGMENGVVNIVNNLSGDIDSKIYCMHAIGSLAEKLNNSENVYFAGVTGGVIDATKKLFSYCRLEKPDILHSHSWGTLISSFVVSKVLGIKLIHGEHGTVYFNRLRDRVVQKLILKRTDLNLFVSNELKQRFENQLGLKKNLKVIFNGVDIERFKPNKSGKHQSNEPEAVITMGTIGRLVPVKNQQWLISQMSGLSEYNVRLVVVGDGPCLTNLQKIINENNLNNKVELFGVSDQPEKLLNNFDIFVLPSLSEGMSNTILEAMATGLPILASDVGGNSDLVRHGVNGYLYKLSDLDAYLTHVVKLVSNESIRQEFGANSLEIVKNEFSLSMMIENYHQAYLTVYQGKL